MSTLRPVPGFLGRLPTAFHPTPHTGMAAFAAARYTNHICVPRLKLHFGQFYLFEISGCLQPTYCPLNFCCCFACRVLGAQPGELSSSPGHLATSCIADSGFLDREEIVSVGRAGGLSVPRGCPCSPGLVRSGEFEPLV